METTALEVDVADIWFDQLVRGRIGLFVGMVIVAGVVLRAEVRRADRLDDGSHAGRRAGVIVCLVLEDDCHPGATRVLSRRLRRRHEELRGDPGQVAIDDGSAKACRRIDRALQRLGAVARAGFLALLENAESECDAGDRHAALVKQSPRTGDVLLLVALLLFWPITARHIARPELDGVDVERLQNVDDFRQRMRL